MNNNNNKKRSNNLEPRVAQIAFISFGMCVTSFRSTLFSKSAFISRLVFVLNQTIIIILIIVVVIVINTFAVFITFLLLWLFFFGGEKRKDLHAHSSLLR